MLFVVYDYEFKNQKTVLWSLGISSDGWSKLQPWRLPWQERCGERSRTICSCHMLEFTFHSSLFTLHSSLFTRLCFHRLCVQSQYCGSALICFSNNFVAVSTISPCGSDCGCS